MKTIILILTIIFLCSCNKIEPVHSGMIVKRTEQIQIDKAKYLVEGCEGYGWLYFYDKPNKFSVGDTLWFFKITKVSDTLSLLKFPQ